MPRLGPSAAYVEQAIRDKLIEHKQYIHTHGEDMPEVSNWRWGARAPVKNLVASTEADNV